MRIHDSDSDSAGIEIDENCWAIMGRSVASCEGYYHTLVLRLHPDGRHIVSGRHQVIIDGQTVLRTCNVMTAVDEEYVTAALWVCEHLDMPISMIDDLLRTPKLPSPSAATRWGSSGTRYDEECDRCHRETQVDNDTGMCRSCGS